MKDDSVYTGFSGLSKLVSNIDDINIEEENAAQHLEASSSQPASLTAGNASETIQKPQASAAPKKVFSGWGLTYLLGILVIGGMILAYNKNNSSPNYASSPSSEPVSTYPSNAADNSYNNFKNNSVSTQENIPLSSEFACSRPGRGTNNILSVSEIRWCQKELIRIEELRNYITTDLGVKKFNSLIDDYNSRCSSYRYRKGDLARAKRDVEDYRSRIVEEAIREAATLNGKVATSSRTQPATTGNSNSFSEQQEKATLVRQVQQLLTDLGYAPGPVDGFYGRKTREAIMLFQRHKGLVEDGLATELLLSNLKRARNDYGGRYQ